MALMQTEEDLIIACALNEAEIPDVTHLVVLPDEEDPAESGVDPLFGGPAVVVHDVEEDDEYDTEEDLDEVVQDLKKAIDLLMDCQVLYHLLPMSEIKKIVPFSDWHEITKLERRLHKFLDQWKVSES